MRWRRAALKAGKWAATLLFLTVALTYIASSRFGPQAFVGIGERRVLVAIGKGAVLVRPLPRPPRFEELTNGKAAKVVGLRQDVDILDEQIAILEAMLQHERLRNHGWIFKIWWSNGALLLPLWMPLAALALPVGILWRRDFAGFRRARSGHCIECGYDRRGLAADAKCPECGTVSVR